MRQIITFVIAAVLLIPCLILLVAMLIWEGISWVHRNHEKASEKVRDPAKAIKVIAALASFWAWLVAPTGLAAIGAGLGIVSTPLIVVLAPALLALAGAALTVSAALELYSRWLKRKHARD